tara:strand:+ start:2025 stop:2243 length:219 start_codon:yes stop_codon:yes gene_type:complete
MRILTIQWDSINIPQKNRYTILSDGEKSAVYKRYFKIFYIRITKVYIGHERFTGVITKYNKLITKNRKQWEK